MSPRNFLFISEQNKAYFSAGNKNNQITKHISIISAVKIEQTKKKPTKLGIQNFQDFQHSLVAQTISHQSHIYSCNKVIILKKLQSYLH